MVPGDETASPLPEITWPHLGDHIMNLTDGE